MNAIDRQLQRELARPQKLEEHTRKGHVLGIGPEDHARLSYLFLKARVESGVFRGLTGPALTDRIRVEWQLRVLGGPPAPSAPPAAPNS